MPGSRRVTFWNSMRTRRRREELGADGLADVARPVEEFVDEHRRFAAVRTQPAVLEPSAGSANRRLTRSSPPA